MRATCSTQSEPGPTLGGRYGLRRGGPLGGPMWHVCGPADIGHIDLTSATPPPGTGLGGAGKSPSAVPSSRRWGGGTAGAVSCGLRSLGHPRPRLTARTDDSHAAPLCAPASTRMSGAGGAPLQLVRCPVYCRIKPHTPPFQQAPAKLIKSPALRLFPRRGAPRLRGGGPPAPIVDGMDYQSVKY